MKYKKFIETGPNNKTWVTSTRDKKCELSSKNINFIIYKRVRTCNNINNNDNNSNKSNNNNRESLENIPLQMLSRRSETTLYVHLGEQGLRTWNEYLVCDIFHKGDIVKAIMKLRLPSNIKNPFISSITMKFSSYDPYYYYYHHHHHQYHHLVIWGLTNILVSSADILTQTPALTP